jgi:hypothetical protein
MLPLCFIKYILTLLSIILEAEYMLEVINQERFIKAEGKPFLIFRWIQLIQKRRVVVLSWLNYYSTNLASFGIVITSPKEALHMAINS